MHYDLLLSVYCICCLGVSYFHESIACDVIWADEMNSVFLRLINKINTYFVFGFAGLKGSYALVAVFLAPPSLCVIIIIINLHSEHRKT